MCNYVCVCVGQLPRNRGVLSLGFKWSLHKVYCTIRSEKAYRWLLNIIMLCFFTHLVDVFKVMSSNLWVLDLIHVNTKWYRKKNSHVFSSSHQVKNNNLGNKTGHQSLFNLPTVYRAWSPPWSPPKKGWIPKLRSASVDSRCWVHKSPSANGARNDVRS